MWKRIQMGHNLNSPDSSVLMSSVQLTCLTEGSVYIQHVSWAWIYICSSLRMNAPAKEHMSELCSLGAGFDGKRAFFSLWLNEQRTLAPLPLCSHMPIRRVRWLIASQPLGWRGSERHTWLHRFMTSSLQPSLSSLFMGPVLVWRPSVQLLLIKKKCKQRWWGGRTQARGIQASGGQEVNPELQDAESISRSRFNKVTWATWVEVFIFWTISQCRSHHLTTLRLNLSPGSSWCDRNEMIKI